MDRVIAVGDMFGISDRRAELHALMAALELEAAAGPGCHRYSFATRLTDPDHVVLVSEWENLEALERHHRSEAFTSFQRSLRGLLVRTSELTVHAVGGTVRPVDTLPMDPRDAD
jgi:quinol monooxygenase YgiN